MPRDAKRGLAQSFLLTALCGSDILACMNLREYERLKAKAQADYRRQLEAIETVWKMSGGIVENGAKPQQTNGIEKGSYQRVIRIALDTVPKEFTVRDVFNAIKVSNPDFAESIKDKIPSLSGALKRMEKDKELVLIETGSGKRPSKYRRAG
jgi:hypothetical protein